MGSERLELPPSVCEDGDTLRLSEYLLEQGASRAEIEEAARTGTLGPLALELALRPPGERIEFPEAAAQAGLDEAQATALWRALGFPDPVRAGVTLTPSQVQMLAVFAEMGRSEFGFDTVTQLARVMSGSLAVLAEAVVDAFRVRVEMPRRLAGEPTSDVVMDYASMASVAFPAFAEAVRDVLCSHILSVSRGTWSLDEERATVTRELAVGFVDLVDYTGRTMALSPAGLAATIARFEQHVGEVVAGFDGRLVKLIGDEAMFVVDDAGRGCVLARSLLSALEGDPQLPSVRIGLAAGPVIGLHGDYYGAVVNLAARLAKLADPGEALIAEGVVSRLSSDVVGYEALAPARLKGHRDAVPAFRLTD